MDSFNLSKLKDYIPSVDLPKSPLARISSWGLSSDPNPDNDNEARPSSQAQEEDQIDKVISNDPPITLEEPIPVDRRLKSDLDLINECDNFPYYHTDSKLFFQHVNTYYGLYVKDYPETELGYILPSVVEVFRGLSDWKIDDNERSLTLLTGSNEEERTKAVAFTTQAMRATEHFEVLKGWRNELYPVYGPNRELLFSIERAASALFGIVTYGVHMTVYTWQDDVPEEGLKNLMIWVPRRAADKQTYGGMLDNTVAGGISTHESPFESLVRESMEEASLPEELVRGAAKAVGTVTYFHIRDSRAGGETRLLQPECQYVYDLEVPKEIVPKPSDDEVAGFELMSLDQVREALRNGEFKPNCALVLLDFFVRHGILSHETPGYIEIVARLHRRLDFPTV